MYCNCRCWRGTREKAAPSPTAADVPLYFFSSYTRIEWATHRRPPRPFTKTPHHQFIIIIVEKIPPGGSSRSVRRQPPACREAPPQHHRPKTLTTTTTTPHRLQTPWLAPPFLFPRFSGLTFLVKCWRVCSCERVWRGESGRGG